MLNDIYLLALIVMLSTVIGILAYVAYKMRARFLHLDKQLSQITNSINNRIDNRIDNCVTTFANSLDEKIMEVQNTISLMHMPFKFPVFLGNASIDSHHARFLVQHLVEVRPKTIVELGSGSSTLIIAHVLNSLGIKDVYHLSVDQEIHYLKISERWAELNGVSNYVKFFHAPLTPYSGHDTPWYSGVTHAVQDRKIELVLVDGPAAYEAGFEYARYPALPALYSLLSEHCTIILDDANRPAEQSIVKRWLTEYPEFNASYIKSGKGVAILRR